MVGLYESLERLDDSVLKFSMGLKLLHIYFSSWFLSAIPICNLSVQEIKLKYFLLSFHVSYNVT